MASRGHFLSVFAPKATKGLHVEVPFPLCSDLHFWGGCIERTPFFTLQYNNLKRSNQGVNSKLQRVILEGWQYDSDQLCND